MTVKLVLAGAGNMGYAMLAGWVKSGKLAPASVLVVEPNAGLRDRAAALGCRTAETAAGLSGAAAPELIVLAVKPQVIREVSAAYKRFGNGATTFVSIAAGTPVSTFKEVLGQDTPIVRCMPNTPASISKGMMVVFATAAVREAARREVIDLLSASGAVATIEDETLMDAVTAVSGSGPAYVFHFIESLTAAAEAVGLPAETAKLLAMQTVFGAASLAKESSDDPGELRRQVTSPNGTTAAALAVLMGDDRLKTLVKEAVLAARDRSVDLGKG